MDPNVNFTSTPHEERITLSTSGKILIGITGGLALGVSVVCIPFVSPAIRKFCLPYIPATHRQVSNVFRALEGRAGSLLDVGSGDGRIVLGEAARRGFDAYGVELNPWLVLYSVADALQKGASGKAKFVRADLWKHHFGGYDNVVVFGVEQMVVDAMGDLEKKFLRECTEKANIVACRFPLPNLQPLKTVGYGIDTVWLYEIKK